jgi:asparagine synthase (glutamine-hydrolysing)
MALQSSEPVKTFSIGFEEASFNELPYAQLVAQQYRTEHHAIVVRPDCTGLVSKLVQHFDEPFGDSSAIPTFVVSEFAARHVKVALSGDGGDELFAGYESFFRLDALRWADRIPAAAKAVLARLSDWLPYAAYGKNYLRVISRPSPLGRYFELNYAPYHLRKTLLDPAWMLPADGAHLHRALADCLLPEGADALLQAFYFEAIANLTGDMLVKVDRMSMANSLEVRCPLLDHKLAELAMALPPDWKMHAGRGKRILLKALADRLPPAAINREKRGFAVPLPIWFRGELKEFLHDHLLAKRFANRKIASPHFVRYMIDEHMRGRRDNSHWLWQLLMLELWFREHENQIEARRGTRPLAAESVSLRALS